MGKRRIEFRVSVLPKGIGTVWQVVNEKKRYLDLLLLADEQESLIDRYLERGEMFLVRKGGNVLAVCVVTRESEEVREIKNIAVHPDFQRKGVGRALVDFVFARYQGTCRRMMVGTGDTRATLGFYESCGFRYSHRIADFFTDNYDKPIIEEGKQLCDMVYLQREL